MSAKRRVIAAAGVLAWKAAKVGIPYARRKLAKGGKSSDREVTVEVKSKPTTRSAKK